MARSWWIGVTGRNLDLDEVHGLLFEMLCAVDEICRTAGIEYWLDAGTTLGALRHEDLLAWDDDVDICMTPGNLAAFIRVSGMLPEGLHLLVRRGGRGPTAKIVDRRVEVREHFAEQHGLRGENVPLLALDIMEVVPVSSYANHIIQSFLGKALALKPIAAQMSRSPARLGAPRRLSWYVLSAAPEGVMRALHRPERTVSHSGGNWWSYSLCGANPRVRWPTRSIWPLSTIVLRGRRFPAPSDLPSYLTALYGSNYRIPPPPAEQLSHFTDFRRVYR